MGKGEIARNEQFLLFPQCFLLNQIIVSSFVNNLDRTSLFVAEFEKPKIGISGKGLSTNFIDIFLSREESCELFRTRFHKHN